MWQAKTLHAHTREHLHHQRQDNGCTGASQQQILAEDVWWAKAIRSRSTEVEMRVTRHAQT